MFNIKVIGYLSILIICDTYPLRISVFKPSVYFKLGCVFKKNIFLFVCHILSFMVFDIELEYLGPLNKYYKYFAFLVILFVYITAKGRMPVLLCQNK